MTPPFVIPSLPFAIPALPFVIPAKAGIQTVVEAKHRGPSLDSGFRRNDAETPSPRTRSGVGMTAPSPEGSQAAAHDA
ncbi:MAG: hypothetical protein CVU17_02610 [Betaproteobacteria bacterium HGW-Betaproteobacteria-11]|nr:MAG: hypothetical protein CVU17_02610 [Betaproteobacteria bacterium HGW-Betaproteobacteria-11]